MLRFLLALTLGAWVAAPAVAQTAPLTVFLVRHAEKGPENPDPSLTDAGRRRAEDLARTLASSGATALFASEFKRTQETLAPLASATGLRVTAIPGRAVDSLVAALRALPPGSRAVVASHSNLIHVIVERLAGAGTAELTDADYDRLYVVTVRGERRGDVLLLHFGLPYAAGAAAPMTPRP